MNATTSLLSQDENLKIKNSQTTQPQLPNQRGKPKNQNLFPPKKHNLRDSSQTKRDQIEKEPDREFKSPQPKKLRKEHVRPKKDLVRSSSLSDLQLHNRYELLSDSEVAMEEDEPIITSNKEFRPRIKQTAPTASKPKPVVVDTSFLALRNVINKLDLSSKPTFKILNAEKKTRVMCQSIDDKKKLIEKLKEQKFVHHTYTENSEKPLLLVLKGMYHATLDEVIAELKMSGIPATKVTWIYENKEHPIYRVHFVKGSTTVKALTHEHRHINGAGVKWSTVDNSKKLHTQCYRCQEWGHSASNCGKLYRCVKCDQQHEPGNCSRKTREGNPRCVNCKGEHAANSRRCKAYSDYCQQMEARRRTAPAKRRATSNPAPWAHDYHSEFPELPPRQQPSTQVTSNNRSTTAPVSFSLNPNPLLSNRQSSPNIGTSGFNSFVEAQARLQAIPDIAETFSRFNRMVDKLEAAPNQNARMLILLSFCQPQNAY